METNDNDPVPVTAAEPPTATNTTAPVTPWFPEPKEALRLLMQKRARHASLLDAWQPIEEALTEEQRELAIRLSDASVDMHQMEYRAIVSLMLAHVPTLAHMLRPLIEEHCEDGAISQLRLCACFEAG